MIVPMLAVSLRMQLTSEEALGRSKERVFAEFVVCNVLLFLFATNFMG